MILIPGNNIIVPDKDPDYVLDPLTLVNEYNWSMLTSADWSDMGLRIRRYPNQTEIDYYEEQYTKILQTLNLNPSLYQNPYADPNNPLYNPSSPHFNDQNLVINVFTDSNYNINLQYRMPNDTQLKKALLGKKPFGGIQIYTTSLSFQISRQSSKFKNIPYFVCTGDSSKDAHVVKFGLKADWGFAPVSLMS